MLEQGYSKIWTLQCSGRVVEIVEARRPCFYTVASADHVREWTPELKPLIGSCAMAVEWTATWRISRKECTRPSPLPDSRSGGRWQYVILAPRAGFLDKFVSTINELQDLMCRKPRRVAHKLVGNLCQMILNARGPEWESKLMIIIKQWEAIRANFII